MPGMQQDNRNGRWSAAADLAARCPFAPNSFGGHRIRVRAIEIAAKGRPAGRPPAWTRPQASIADYLTGALAGHRTSARCRTPTLPRQADLAHDTAP